MSLQYAVSRRSLGSHCTPGGVTPPLGINDRGVIQPGESLIPLTPAAAVPIFGQLTRAKCRMSFGGLLICCSKRSYARRDPR